MSQPSPRLRAVKRIWLSALLLVLVTAGGTPASAQELEAGALLLIMDASGSMNAVDDGGTRLIDGAKAALNRVVDELPDGTPVGLRVYGHRTPNTDPVAGCQDTELIAPVAPLDRESVKSAIDGFNASGYTPIGLSLQEAERDLPPEGPRTIVLVSDGEDTCAPPDPCQVARDLSARGVDVRIETVGFYLQGNPAATNQLTCIAEATGGSFRTADNAAQLADELSQLSARALREFQAQGTAVEGAPALVEAPVLEAGTYTDTLLPDEASWYAVELEEDEELVFTVTRAGVPDFEGGGLNSPYLEVYFADPDLGEANTASSRGYVREDSEISAAQTVQIRTGVVGVDPPPPFMSSGELRPGTYAVRVLQENSYDDEGLAGREIPVELTFEVAGEAEEEVSPSPSPSPSPTEAEPSPTPSVTEAAEEDGGIPATTIIIALLAALVLLMAAALVVLLRRGRQPPT